MIYDIADQLAAGVQRAYASQKRPTKDNGPKAPSKAEVSAAITKATGGKK